MHHTKIITDHIRTLADRIVAERFFSEYGVTSLDEYLDHLDSNTTAHLNSGFACRVLRTAGDQRRKAKLTIEGGAVIIAIPMTHPRTKATIWVELYLSTWLEVTDCGADGAWYFLTKGKDRNDGQIVAKIPLSRGDKATINTIARIIVGAKPGQQACIRDHNPLNLRTENVQLRGRPGTAEGKAGTAKTDARGHSRDKKALRASLPKKGDTEC